MQADFLLYWKETARKGDTAMKRHDLHLHTALSLCARETAAVPGYLEQASKLGLDTIGFSNHVWDSRVPMPGPNPWYEAQSVERAMEIRKTVPTDTGEIRVLIGVETEFAQGVLGLSEEAAVGLDYVLIPHSHIHMTDFVCPHEVSEPAEIARHMAGTFRDLVTRGTAAIRDSGTPVIVAHPFCPVARDGAGQLTAIFAHLSDGLFEDLFGRAAEQAVGIEINLNVFHGNPGASLYEDTYYRMFAAAKRMGCRFSIGSDSHAVEELDRIRQDEEVIRRSGLEDGDFIDLVRL